MSIIFNPFSGNFDYVGGGSTLYLPTVQSESDLPSGDQDGAVRVVLDTDRVYVYDSVGDTWTDSGTTVAAFSASANAAGVSIAVTADGVLTNILRPNLVLHAADATNPGGLSITDQEISGNKDFQNNVVVQGQVKTNTIDALNSGDTLGIGIADADIINIGRSGTTVNIIGTTNVIDVTNLNVTDKNITVNSGGSAGSGSDAGIEVEENAIITGYVKVSADRVSWRLKSPGASGEFFLAPNNNGYSQVVASDVLTSNRTYTLPDISGTLVLTEGNQTINGNKTLSGTTILSGLTASTPLKLDGSKNIISSDIDLTTDVTGVLPAANGGTNSNATLNNNRIIESNAGAIVERAALTNGQLIIGSTGANPVNASLTAGAGISVTPGAGSISIVNTTVVTGDIAPTDFVAAQTVAAPTNVTGFAFSNATVRSFVATIDVVLDATSDLVQTFRIKGVQKSSSWDISYDSVGDNTVVAFSITSAGQIQYISSTYPGFVSLNMKFSAKVMPF